jgi:hypothetical protein
LDRIDRLFRANAPRLVPNFPLESPYFNDLSLGLL